MNILDGLIIPGEVARRTIVEHWHVRKPRLIYWPNLVDECVYRDQVAEFRTRRGALRARYEIPIDNRVLYWSARLDEYTKGILNFLNAVEPVLEPTTSILLAGEGPDRPRVERWLTEHPHVDVRLLGHLSQDEVVACLALSDIAILPSLRDPNPLSIIEAMWAALPVLNSINCGNWPETVINGENGWLVDPANEDELQRALIEIQACSSDQLRSMGRVSLALAEERFASRPAVRRFVDDLLAAFPPRQ